MHPPTAKSLLKVIGTGIGLFGVLMLHRAYISIHQLDYGGLSAGLIMGFYFGWVGWLTWFRFSPQAIRHICGSALFVILLIEHRAYIRPIPVDSSLQGALTFALIVGVVWIYRRIWRYFTSLLFPEEEIPPLFRK